MPSVKYGDFPIDALEDVEYSKAHGRFKQGDKRKIHPNTAILLRSVGVLVVKEKATIKAKKVETKKED